MSADRDDAAMRRYREASAALDERPSAATRAAILAAAARQVEARPHSADAPRVVRRPRWPLAAAAAVLLSTLAVMMATRTEEERPAFTAPAEPAPESFAAAPVPSSVPPPPSDSVAPALPSTRAQAPSQTAKKSAPSGPRDEQALTAPSETVQAPRSEAAMAGAPSSSARGAPEVARAESRQALPAPPPAAPPAADPVARSAPAPFAGPMRAPDSGGPVTPEPSSTDRAAAREAVPVPQGAARLDAAREFEGSAPAWLERIVRLRGEGRDAEADAELKRFRERHPEAQVPVAALPRGSGPGTR